MSDTINNGGPAFPVVTRPMETEHGFGHQFSNSTWQYGGMTLRDYFAAAALHGLIAYHGDKMHIVDKDGRTSLHLIAYDHADAMLRARETT